MSKIIISCLFCFVIFGCKRTNYACFQDSNQERNLRNFYDLSLEKLELRQNKQFSAINKDLPVLQKITDASDVAFVKEKLKKQTPIVADTVDKTQKKGLFQFQKNETPDYDKIGKISGILGSASFVLFGLAYSFFFSFTLIPYILLSSLLLALVGLVLGIISVKKAKKKLMSILGIVFGAYAIIMGLGILLIIAIFIDILGL